jgi:hypothetical protein
LRGVPDGSLIKNCLKRRTLASERLSLGTSHHAAIRNVAGGGIHAHQLRAQSGTGDIHDSI